MTWTPEGEVKKEIKKILKEYGCYHHMSVRHGYGKRTLDFLVCYGGLFIGIEAKAPGEGPTKFQSDIMEAIKDAGGAAICVDDANTVRVLLEAIKANAARNLARQESQRRYISRSGRH